MTQAPTDHPASPTPMPDNTDANAHVSTDNVADDSFADIADATLRRRLRLRHQHLFGRLRCQHHQHHSSPPRPPTLPAPPTPHLAFRHSHKHHAPVIAHHPRTSEPSRYFAVPPYPSTTNHLGRLAFSITSIIRSWPRTSEAIVPPAGDVAAGSRPWATPLPIIRRRLLLFSYPQHHLAVFVS